MEMNRTDNKILSGASTIIHSLAIPLFALIFTIYYKPQGTFEVLDMENASFSFNVTILFCILLVNISITRGWLYLLGKYREVSSLSYIVWSIGEMIISSLFISLYIVLMTKGQMQFFEVAGSSFARLISTCIYPYLFLWMGFEIKNRNQEEPMPAEDNSLIRFHDEYKKLRFVIAPEAVMFIRSEDNYVQIHYLDQSRPKKFILRSSMRALEETLTRHGLVRCHRSYFINPSYIKMVHRDNAGLIVADLRQDGFESIPISRKYQSEITRLL